MNTLDLLFYIRRTTLGRYCSNFHQAILSKLDSGTVWDILNETNLMDPRLGLLVVLKSFLCIALFEETYCLGSVSSIEWLSSENRIAIAIARIHREYCDLILIWNALCRTCITLKAFLGYWLTIVWETYFFLELSQPQDVPRGHLL